MKFTELELKGAYLIEIQKIEDDRGFFGRSWCHNEFQEHGLNPNIKQINTSLTKKKGTIRGMHYQVDPYQETKFVRCTSGRIFDVIIDLRPESPTFMQWSGNELSSDNYRMVYVPGNFAHGFISLEDDSEIYYPVTEFYTPGAERGIRFDDPAFNIKWPVPVSVVSEKDSNHPPFDLNTFQKPLNKPKP
ncbi:MAG: dTDP-4-dehydrorhamnose 3,5-epimerase [Bacteroidota bacterium]